VYALELRGCEPLTISNRLITYLNMKTPAVVGLPRWLKLFALGTLLVFVAFAVLHVALGGASMHGH